MIKWFLLMAAIAAAVFVETTYAVAEPSSGGPVIKPVGGCEPPLPSDDAAMSFLSYYEGAAVSPIRLGEGPQGDTTSVVKLKVRRGFKPLYLVIAGGRHSIVSVSGWTRRVEKLVVVTNRKYPVAVAGLPAELVHFVDRESCDHRLDKLYEKARSEDVSFVAGVVKRPHPRSMTAEERARQATAYRMPEAIGGTYEPDTLSVSGSGVGAFQYDTNAHGSVPDWFERANAADFHPGGIGEVELSSLVSPVPAAPYTILPDRAGIAQLIRDGKIDDHGDGNYSILAPIELPEGLCGAMSATFTLAPGVPSPSGDLCHSKLR